MINTTNPMRFVGGAEYLSPAMETTLQEVLQDDAPTDLDKLTTVLTEMKGGPCGSSFNDGY